LRKKADGYAVNLSISVAGAKGGDKKRRGNTSNPAFYNLKKKDSDYNYFQKEV
jgi:hypothetical protein